MLGIGSVELAVIIIFGFLIFGPDKLPQIARTVGRMIRQFKDAQTQVTEVIKTEVVEPLKDSTGASDITAIKDDLQSLISDPTGTKKADLTPKVESKAQTLKPVDLPKANRPAKGSFAERRAALEAQQRSQLQPEPKTDAEPKVKTDVKAGEQ